MSNPLIEDILSELMSEYGMSRYELRKIINSQFKVLRTNISDRSVKTVNLMHIGKFRPTYWLVTNRHNYVPRIKKVKGDQLRMVQPINQEESTNGRAEETDM